MVTRSSCFTLRPFSSSQGMIYLHDSPVKSHGNLKDSNCLIDSRWVLKVADFGLHEFKSGAERTSGNNEDYIHGNRFNRLSSHYHVAVVFCFFFPSCFLRGSYLFIQDTLPGNGGVRYTIYIFFLSRSLMTGLLYRAPELLRLTDPPLQGTQKGDIYSFGILLYAIHGRQGPFGFTPLSPTDILKKVVEHTPPLPPPFRSRFSSLIDSLISHFVLPHSTGH